MMQKKMILRLSKVMASVVLLSLHSCSYAVVTYIPQALRDCVSMVHAMAEKKDNANNMAELYSMIEENRILTSDTMVRKAVEEVFHILESDATIALNENQKQLIKNYLREYSNNLDNSSVIASMHGDEVQRTSWPISLVARSFDGASDDMDMMCLSSELASVKSLQLYGASAIDFSLPYDVAAQANTAILKSIKPNKITDPGIVFNASTMTNSIYTVPTVIFGTGVSSPSINAWSMPVSSSVQSPINIQFSIPGNFKKHHAVSLELHFLVKQDPGFNGNARIQIDAKYMGNDKDFNIMSSVPTFTSTTISDDFLIVEPTSSTSLKHISVIIPLENSGIRKSDFALLSLTRIQPTDWVEYGHDIYLASAVFTYKSKG